MWFHGGCFVGGSPDSYDGSAIVEESGGDVIVVTVAFRLGVFGHLASNGLKARSRIAAPGNQPGSAGNWGIQDQREALRWVQKNIAAFGGDPGNVLIFGESSGGASVSSHMIMTESFPLFHKAIIESGSFTSWGTHSCEQHAPFASVLSWPRRLDSVEWCFGRRGGGRTELWPRHRRTGVQRRRRFRYGRAAGPI